MRQHVRLAAFAGVLRLLVRETCQPPIMAAVRAVRVAAVLLRQFLRRETPHVCRKRLVRQLHPRLIVAGTGLDGRSRRKTFRLHALQRLRREVIDQHEAMLARRTEVHIVALGVHSLEPRGGLHKLCNAPLAVHHLAGLGLPDAHLDMRHAQRRYLPLEGFKASVTAGFRCSATARGSSSFLISGGRSQSQNTVTSMAVSIPVTAASA